MLVVLAVWVVGLPGLAAGAERQPQIIGGQPAADGAWPFMTSINLHSDFGGDDLADHGCGGAVVHPHWVLTAAHCFELYDEHGGVSHIPPEALEVIIGRTQLSAAGGTKVDIEDYWWLTERQHNTVGTDIALVRLASPVSAPPVSLPAQSELAQTPVNTQGQADGTVIALGWGVRQSGSTTNSDALMEVGLPLWSAPDCGAVGQIAMEYGFPGVDATRELCAGGEWGKDTCQGDSGGPLVRRDVDGVWWQIGVTARSFAPGCGDEIPGLYTWTTAHRGFIDDVFAEYGEPSPFQVPGQPAGPPAPEPDPGPTPDPSPEPDAAPPPAAEACGPDTPPVSFTDTPEGSVHARAIDCVVAWGIAQGTGPSLYSPSATVSRAQMASFIARAMEAAGRPLDAGPDQQFGDIAGNPHAERINQLATAGIVGGTGPGEYAPNQPVTRAQMATFLVRAYEFVTIVDLPSSDDYFDDDAGNVHEPNINKAAEAGMTTGIGPRAYSPAGEVRRDQMASFLQRWLDALVRNGYLTAG